MKPKILFIAEAVSMAHVARPSVLARSLNPDLFDIHFANNGAYPLCHTGQPWSYHQLPGISPLSFLKRLSNGEPVFTETELATYVQDDLALIEREKPDLIISDFRLSLGISARYAQVPFYSICNAHWSPYFKQEKIPAPDISYNRLFGHNLFEKIFNLSWPFFSRLHVKAANHLRRKYRLAEYPSLREFYCDGDLVMYADTPSLIPLTGAPKTHVHIGPIIWSPPPQELPYWWQEATQKQGQPIYITLGSTGKIDSLPIVVNACRTLNTRCFVATGGRHDLQSAPPWIFAADFLPGSEAAKIAPLVICNGGSATAHQALAQGTPIFGICSNLDQLQTMSSLKSAGAGEWILGSQANPQILTSTIKSMLNCERYSIAAKSLAQDFKKFDARENFCNLMNYRFFA